MDDADAFSELYRGEAESVLIFLTRRTFDAEIAVELTAETFAIALCSWGKLRGLAPEPQRAWLFTVARRRLARYVRRAGVERRAIERLGIEVPSASHDDLLVIEQRAGLADLRVALGRELARLSAGQRQALSMRVVQERPYAEIAELLGVSEDTVRARVSRGLRRLNRGLEQHQATPEGTS
ncbi:MAG TPA: sigma-70 family RNA polymerase sigma factor [Solirubrobacteraceae bacterium]|jgi:RNA polymerase sigma-70 factor (ECF subfamily)|nr:sigma-70 family RNA polymerase sigma factor [Solirubrobacteraceae bacterium]